MKTVLYLANEFPAAVEWYIAEEIRELRRRGLTVIPCSAKAIPVEHIPPEARDLAQETIAVRPLSAVQVLTGIFLCILSGRRLADLWRRILFEGSEGLRVRIRAVAHTFLGICLAHRLRSENVAHIHVHHGYYASWIALVAARLLNVPFSLTLHGSDLLVNAVYLDLKLHHCDFCLTVSEFNRRYILAHFPTVSSDKILVNRMGVAIPDAPASRRPHGSGRLTLLAVGRLHPVKNHMFLIQACFFLKESGLPVRCLIAGDGPERCRLEMLIDHLGLQDTVQLLGHIPRAELVSYYDRADLVVLTSRSEGIPITLMEAMARSCLVLAPAITGIPELVVDGVTGFLYPPGALEEFVWRVTQIARALPACDRLRRAGYERVSEHFQLATNLQTLGDLFLHRVGKAKTPKDETYEDPVLQQI